MKKKLLPVLLFCWASWIYGQQTQTQTQTQTQPVPPSTDIFLAKVKIHGDSFQLDQPVNITKRTGYDNQPFFTPEGRTIFYTAILEDGQADIFEYSVASGQSRRLTSTPESEYSPTLMPDGKHISVVRVEADETQRLWKFPLSGEAAPKVILPGVKPVGYHAWIDSNTVVLFLLGEPPTLQWVSLSEPEPRRIARNIGRSLRVIPGKKQLSFVEKKSEEEWLIQSYDWQTEKFETVVRTLPQVEDFIWSPDGTALLSAKGSRLYRFRPQQDQSWQEVSDLEAFSIRSITRIAVSPSFDHIALVAEE